MSGNDDRGATERLLGALGTQTRRRIVGELYKSSREPGRVRLQLSSFPSGEAEERVQLQLVHQDLPKLQELGYVRYSDDYQFVTTGSNWGEIEELLDFLHAHADDLPASIDCGFLEE